MTSMNKVQRISSSSSSKEHQGKGDKKSKAEARNAAAKKLTGHVDKFRPVTIKPWPMSMSQRGDGNIPEPGPESDKKFKFNGLKKVLFPYFDTDTDDYHNALDCHIHKKNKETVDSTTTATLDLTSSKRILPPSPFYPDWDALDLVSCSICMEPFVEATLLGCGHLFCRDCIGQWMCHKKWCPLCQVRIEYLTRDFTMDRIISYLFNYLPPCTQENLQFGHSRRVDKIMRDLVKQRSYADCFRGRIAFYWDSFTNPFSTVQTTIENKGVMYLLNYQLSRAYQIFNYGQESQEAGQTSFWKSWTFLHSFGLFVFGLLLGYIFNAVDWCSFPNGNGFGFIPSFPYSQTTPENDPGANEHIKEYSCIHSN